MEISAHWDINTLVKSEMIEKQRRAASLALGAAQLSKANLKEAIEAECAEQNLYGSAINLTANCALTARRNSRNASTYQYFYDTDGSQITAPIQINGELWGVELVESSKIGPLDDDVIITEQCAYQPLEICLAVQDDYLRRTLVALRHIQGYVSLDA